MKHTALASLYAFALADVDSVEHWAKIVALLAPVIVGVVQMLRRPPRREPKTRRNPTVTRSVLSLVVAIVAVSALQGCAKDRVSSIVRALGSDTNAVTVKVVSPWGTVDVRRNAAAQ